MYWFLCKNQVLFKLVLCWCLNLLTLLHFIQSWLGESETLVYLVKHGLVLENIGEIPFRLSGLIFVLAYCKFKNYFFLKDFISTYPPHFYFNFLLGAQKFAKTLGKVCIKTKIKYHYHPLTWFCQNKFTKKRFFCFQCQYNAGLHNMLRYRTIPINKWYHQLMDTKRDQILQTSFQACSKQRNISFEMSY